MQQRKILEEEISWRLARETQQGIAIPLYPIHPTFSTVVLHPSSIRRELHTDSVKILRDASAQIFY